MSFLGHLLDRSTGPVDGVRPRRRSAFEAWPAGAPVAGSLPAGPTPGLRADAGPRRAPGPGHPSQVDRQTPVARREPTRPAPPAHPVEARDADTERPRRPPAPSRRGSRDEATSLPASGEAEGGRSRDTLRPTLGPAAAPGPRETSRHGRRDTPATDKDGPGDPRPTSPPPAERSRDATPAPPPTAATPRTGEPGPGEGAEARRERRAGTDDEARPTGRPAPRTGRDVSRRASRTPGDADDRPTLGPRPTSPRPTPPAEEPGARDGGRGMEGPSAAEAASPVPPEAPSAPRAPVTVEGIRPRSETEAPGARERPQGPPPIHVSIGRVEVRAARPSPEPRRSRERPAPMVSLEEYLERDGRPA